MLLGPYAPLHSFVHLTVYPYVRPSVQWGRPALSNSSHSLQKNQPHSQHPIQYYSHLGTCGAHCRVNCFPLRKTY